MTTLKTYCWIIYLKVFQYILVKLISWEKDYREKLKEASLNLKYEHEILYYKESLENLTENLNILEYKLLQVKSKLGKISN